MAGKERMRSSRSPDHELPQTKDPLGSLPNLCVYAILENFTAVELIGVRRVSRGWKEVADWRIARIMKKSRPDLAKGADEEQASLEFCRDIFRQEARNYGRPTLARTFTHATQGFAVCGDYFCWVDDTCLNIQLVFNTKKTRCSPQAKQYPLTSLLGDSGLSIEAIKSQEVGSITDRPLLTIIYMRGPQEGLGNRDEPIPPRIAVICVKSGVALWSTAHDRPPHPLAPFGELVTLNHTMIAYIAKGQQGSRPILYVRDNLTGEIKANKPIPAGLLLLRNIFRDGLIAGISFQLHPRRDLVYIAAREKVCFFSATTANCVGRLSLARVSSGHLGLSYHPDGALRFCFSERQLESGVSAREKFFLYSGGGYPVYYCLEYEVPTEEDISTSEARILQNDNQKSEDNLILKVQRIQIYGDRIWGIHGIPELNPMLKQSAQTKLETVYGHSYMYTYVKFRSFTKYHPYPKDTYDIFLEPEKRDDGSVPIEFYPRGGKTVFVMNPHRHGAPRRTREYNERTCWAHPLPFSARATLTERYMFLAHQNNVFFFGYEPAW